MEKKTTVIVKSLFALIDIPPFRASKHLTFEISLEGSPDLHTEQPLKNGSHLFYDVDAKIVVTIAACPITALDLTNSHRLQARQW